MKKIIWQNILAVSIAIAGINEAISADVQINSKVVQRNFVNLGFERVPDLKWRKSGEWGCRLENGAWTKSYCIFDQQGLEGWKTTAKYEGSMREIELWSAGQLVSGDQNWGPVAAEGKIYAELNSTTAAALYQNVCVSEKDVLNWSFSHRPRENISEQAGFFIANVINDQSTQNKITLDFTNISNGDKYLKKTDLLATDPGKINGNVLNTSWKNYSGENVALNKYLGGKKSAIMAFGFEALQTTGDAARGNWLDNIRLELNPGIEFSAESGSVIESATGTYHTVDFNVVGNVNNNVTIKFIIDQTKVSKPAQYRKNDQGDYKLYALNKDGSVKKEIVPIPDSSNSNILRFEYEMEYDSALKYDTGVTVKGLAIELFDNELSDGDRVVPFELDPEQTGLSVMDLRSCGDKVFSGFKYEILDDEVDLEVKKALLEKTPLPGQKVTYDIELFNHKDAVAQNVILKDEILANLNKDEAKLECIDFTNKAEGETCLAPLNNLDVASLFSKDGVKIGTIKGNTRYKFRVSNLTLNAQDSGQGNYAGIFANKITVSTSSNDIEPKNNEAIAENLYPAKSDLMNDHAAGTGEGLFVIDNDGKALWEQMAQDNKAYFPLKIKNTAKLNQEYQLYASSSAIQPTIAKQELSSLKKESIGSYTDQIKIEFFELSNGQCNSNIPSAKQITQLEVKAESIGEVCAVITIYPSAKDKYDIWFAIESIQTGLGDIIRDAVTSVPFVQRLLELLNDQKAQVNVGGSFVFLHRLLNHGTDDEKDISLQLVPVNGDDGFLYSLFVDKNNDGQLDAKDEMVTSLDQKYSLGKAEVLQLLVKVQSPATATNGMMSQIKLEAIPSNENQSILLESLINTDTVFVGSDQVQVTKTQLKREQCTSISAEEIKNATYTVNSQTIGANDCLIYKISIKNTGSEILRNIDVNDMYPAYTHKWELGHNILPMTSSGEVVEVKGDQVKTTILELLPQQEKSLYFGIKLN
ncbi:hypothetical protein GHJ48_06315 [Acinetobacter sp. dk771]|uniref:DUF11 domain-containing protein n=1 Tax=Acinetobacter wanghuae TaxID=2662362 RepID=A0AA91AG35_9GAMM|nr:DUF11 domain-containing protein [Acinetobacter wanghuae]MQW92012.1 hypothetical protein [Acinetobacter wanghuae]